MKLDIIKIMYFSASENGPFFLIKRVLVFSLIWATIFYGITLNRWYLGGFLILVPAITQLCTIIYCYFSSPRRSLRSNVLFSVVFFAYVTIRHIISRDLLTQGVSDLFLFAFTAFCLISFSKDEYIDFFKCICRTMAYISIISTILSLLTLLIPQNINDYTFLPEIIRFNLSRFYTPPNQRLVGIQGNPNTTARLIAYGFVFCIINAILDSNKKEYRILLGLSFVSTVITLLLTGSRSTMLFLGIAFSGCAIAWFLSWRHYLNEKTNTLVVYFLIVVAISLFVALLLFSISNDFRASVLDLLRVPYKEGDSFTEIANSFIDAFRDASSRNEIRDKSLEAWMTNPIFGVPLDKMTADYPMHIDTSPGAHNSFVQILANTGLIGFSLFILMIGTSAYFMIVTCLKDNDTTIKTLAQFSLVVSFAILVHCFYENLLFTRTSVNAYYAYFILLSGFQFKSLSTQNHNALVNGMTNYAKAMNGDREEEE